MVPLLLTTGICESGLDLLRLGSGRTISFLDHAEPEETVRIQGRNFYISTIHGGNTSPKNIEKDCWRLLSENHLSEGTRIDFYEYKKRIEDLYGHADDFFTVEFSRPINKASSLSNVMALPASFGG